MQSFSLPSRFNSRGLTLLTFRLTVANLVPTYKIRSQSFVLSVLAVSLVPLHMLRGVPLHKQFRCQKRQVAPYKKLWEILDRPRNFSVQRSETAACASRHVEASVVWLIRSLYAMRAVLSVNIYTEQSPYVDSDISQEYMHSLFGVLFFSLSQSMLQTPALKCMHRMHIYTNP